jgi:hypothetical protein
MILANNKIMSVKGKFLSDFPDMVIKLIFLTENYQIW